MKQSIESRKNAISANYEINAELQKKADKLFAEMEKFGAGCKDVGEFEEKFAASSLNQEYLDLFTEIATSGQAKSVKTGTPKVDVGRTMVRGTVVGVAESVMDQAIDNVVPTRAAVHQKVSDQVRGVPVLGDAIDLGQKASYVAHLGKMFGKRKKK